MVWGRPADDCCCRGGEGEGDDGEGGEGGGGFGEGVEGGEQMAVVLVCEEDLARLGVLGLAVEEEEAIVTQHEPLPPPALALVAGRRALVDPAVLDVPLLAEDLV